MKGPIEIGNIILIMVGIALIASGPYIIYRTVTGVQKLRKSSPKASIQPISNGINILIAVAFFFAGILFVMNNLRGNPLH